MQVAKDLIPSAILMNAGEPHPPPPPPPATDVYEKVNLLISGNAVVVFTISNCCMCHVVKQLLFGLGVGPTVVELDRNASGGEIYALLMKLGGGGGGHRRQAVPVVFIGGKYLGGIEAVMSCHINGSLVPLLKDAGALWL